MSDIKVLLREAVRVDETEPDLVVVADRVRRRQRRPVDPSGMVIEDSDRVAIPQPDPEAPDLNWSFDDHVAEVGRLATQP